MNQRKGLILIFNILIRLCDIHAKKNKKKKEIAMTPMDLGTKESSNTKSSYSEVNKQETNKANDRQVFSES
jgi:hypothetical protein